ncbi:MAG: hypothetical protein H6705_04420 [Myxococcales bacterium]|nr:hypothetical protein [Myxococcales bacterium]
MTPFAWARCGLVAVMASMALAGCDDGGGGDAPPPDARVAVDGGGGAGGSPVDRGPELDLGCLCPGAQTCDDAGQCVEPAACAAPEDCLAGRICHDGACADACAGDADCGDGLRCDPVAGVCVPDDRCTTDDDCPGGRCEQGECVAPCAADACPGRQVCDPGTGACVEPDECLEDIDCLDARICVDAACVTPCGEDSECPGAQTCVDGECAEPARCTGDDDCTGDRLCVANACADPCQRAGCEGALTCGGDGRCAEASPCAGDDGCHPGRRCVDGRCASPCVEDAQCPGVERCVDGACVPPTDCVLDAACGAGRICVDGLCADACPARPCPADAICDEGSGRCVVQGACLEAADCQGAQQCLDGRCAEPVFCTGDLDCLGGRVCRAGRCLGLCARDADCPGQQRCAGGECVEGPGCDGDGDCLGGRRCHPTIGACVDRCPDGLCPPGLVCGGGLCGEPAGCLDDSECVGARVCRLGRCGAGECDDSDDCPGVCLDFACADAIPGACACPAGWACVDGGCEQPGPCAAGTCPPGWVCGGDGLCARCDGDDDCPGACVGGLCQDPPACDDPAECLPGHVCPFGRCEIDFAGCVDDGLDHNGPDAALTLPPVALTGLVACEGVADWYRFGDDGALRVTVRFAADRPAPRVRLYGVDAAFDPSDAIAVAATQPGEARIDAPPGEYLLEVSAAPGGGGGYAIDLEDGRACADDVYERPWRNDRNERARRVAPGLIEGSLCGADEDWFHVPLARRLQVDIEGATAEIGARRAPAVVDGPATIRVTGAAGARYRLRVTPLADPAAACAGAAALRFDAAVDATIAGGGDDFAPACRGPGGAERVFRLEVPRAGTLDARLLSPEAGAGLLLYRDCAAAPIVCGGLGNLVAPVEAGVYHLVVDGPYAGQLTARLAAPSPLCVDPAPLPVGEPVPIVLPAGPGDLGGLCTDPDLGAVVRRFRVDAPAIARLSMQGGGPEALVSIRGTCDDGEDARGCDVGVDPSIAPRLGPGDYVAVMQGAGPATVTLALEAAGAEPVFAPACGAPVAVAAGADLVLAGELGAGGAVELALCGAAAGAPDRVAMFRLDAPARVVAFIEAAAFGAQVAIVDAACAGVVACGSAMTGDVSAQLPAGTYGLAFEAVGGGAGPFRVRLQVR